MEKTIKIGKKSVRLNNNISWAIVYRDQFGRDIIPALMPLLASALDIISGLINETGKTENIELTDLAKLADGDALLNAVIHLGGFEFTDLICITTRNPVTEGNYGTVRTDVFQLNWKNSLDVG